MNGQSKKQLRVPRKSEDWDTKKATTVFQTYTISELEWERGMNWLSEHKNKCSAPAPRNKGHTKIFSTGSGLGTGVHIRCENCHEEKDVTDYDLW